LATAILRQAPGSVKKSETAPPLPDKQWLTGMEEKHNLEKKGFPRLKSGDRAENLLFSGSKWRNGQFILKAIT